jgi:hypothetical protein
LRLRNWAAIWRGKVDCDGGAARDWIAIVLVERNSEGGDYVIPWDCHRGRSRKVPEITDLLSTIHVHPQG